MDFHVCFSSSMSYIKPEKVISPKQYWTLTRVLVDGSKKDTYGEQVAIAIGQWEGDTVLAMRWNGNDDKPIGHPQSRGLPIWFIVPKRINESIIETLTKDDQILVNTLLSQ